MTWQSEKRNKLTFVWNEIIRGGSSSSSVVRRLALSRLRRAGRRSAHYFPNTELRDEARQKCQHGMN